MTINGIIIEEQPLNNLSAAVIKHNAHKSAGQARETSQNGKGKLKANALSQMNLMR